MGLQGTGGKTMQPRTQIEHNAGKPRTMTLPWDRELQPAQGAIIDDDLARVRCLVHGHHSDQSGGRLHRGRPRPRNRVAPRRE
jgi:hypothetical protein